MCCFFASLVFFGPRLAFLIYWLIAPVRVNAATQNLNFPWLVSLSALIFAPWTWQVSPDHREPDVDEEEDEEL